MLAQDALYDHIATVRKAFTGPNGGDATTEQVLGNLNVSCVMTSESILLLVAHGRTWDGELLVRSVLEGSYRFAALCVSDERERERRVTEYWDLLPDAARLRQHARAQLLLDAVGDSDVGKESPDLWRPLRDLLLSPTELQTLRDRFPAKARSQLEQLWSFTELAASLSKSDLPGAPHFAAMLHGYTMSSALIHKSGEGVAIVVERAAGLPTDVLPSSSRMALGLSPMCSRLLPFEQSPYTASGTCQWTRCSQHGPATRHSALSWPRR